MYNSELIDVFRSKTRRIYALPFKAYLKPLTRLYKPRAYKRQFTVLYLEYYTSYLLVIIKENRKESKNKTCYVLQRLNFIETNSEKSHLTTYINFDIVKGTRLH